MATKKEAVKQEVKKVQAGEVVALRGGLAVSKVKLSGNTYRTKAPHNQGWWKQLSEAAKDGPVAVSPLLMSEQNPHGIPAGFIGYCLRRKYIEEVK